MWYNPMETIEKYAYNRIVGLNIKVGVVIVSKNG